MLKGMLKSVKKSECQGVKREATFLSNLSAFDDFLQDVYETRRPTTADYDKRRDLIRVFNDVAQELYGIGDNCPVVEEFGSFLMDMFNANSDLDLSINFSKKSVLSARSLQTKTLQKFATKLYVMRDQGRVTNVRPILSARVPVLKVTDISSGVECDLSVENLDGIAKSQIVHLISSIDDRFQKLSFLMKDWAKAQGINSAADGSLNSLSLILLVAFHLQTRDTPILPPFSAILKDGTDLVTVKKSISTFMNFGKNNKESIAELFVSLLIKLDSVDPFWSEGLCASTFQGSWICRKWNPKDGPQLGCISIEDFTDRSQNASRALKKFTTHMAIYMCIHFTLNQIRLFTEGKLDAVKLKEILFGEDPSAASIVIMPVCTKKKKKKQPGGKKKKQPPPGTSRKRAYVTSTAVRKAKSQKISSRSRPTQIAQGSQIEPLTVATHLAGQVISTANSFMQGHGGIRPDTFHAAPNFMSSQPHSVSNLPFQDSRRFPYERTYPENPRHHAPPFMAGPPHPAPYVPTQLSPDLSFQGHREFRPHRSYAEDFSHAAPNFPMSHPPLFSDRPYQSYVGSRREVHHVENFRHDNSWDSRPYNTMPSSHHHPASLHYADHARWERSYAPQPSFPSGPSQYLRDTHEYENRHWRR